MSGPAGGSESGPSSAVSNGNVGVPPNGALIRATARKTSGRATADHAAMGDPKSWPITASAVR